MKKPIYLKALLLVCVTMLFIACDKDSITENDELFDSSEVLENQDDQQSIRKDRVEDGDI